MKRVMDLKKQQTKNTNHGARCQPETCKQAVKEIVLASVNHPKNDSLLTGKTIRGLNVAKIPPPQCDFHWQIDLLPWSSINAFRLASASMIQNGEWLLRRPERLLLEQERQKARRSCSEVSRSAISWLLNKRERSRHLLVSLCVGNALLGRNSILGSGESNSITQTLTFWARSAAQYHPRTKG